MQRNVENFYLYDEYGLEQYLTNVESGKRSISGATLMPHQIIGEVVRLGSKASRKDAEDADAKEQIRAKLAEMELRVAESQWKTLVNRIRDAGVLDNAIAVCDVSGSMGNLHHTNPKHPDPILPSIALSLLLATVAKPPFNGGFITFSETPEFVQLDLTQPLATVVRNLEKASWGYSTNINGVFTNLILPLAAKHNLKQEDMIKRVFVFTDMQFDEGSGSKVTSGKWRTNYSMIKKAYAKKGYEVPEIVYWDLANKGTVEVKADAPGVAMMNGFSASMLKVFMGEEGDASATEEADDWMDVSKDGAAKAVKGKKKGSKKEDFTPANVMKKALMKKSYDGLVVVD
jgi:hypothetical protein